MSIVLKNVGRRFGPVTAVNNVSVTIEEGEFFVMLGPSGCGKTTTLRMIAGLELPTSGTIAINGRDVTYVEPRHRDIAMAFQDYGLYPHLTVAQNIEFPLKVRKVDAAQRKRKVSETAEKLEIAHLLARRPGQLSGGQRQRVSLARALVRSPKVFLMDEPLSNLDARLRAVMRTEIKRLVTSLGITTVYVTHDQIEAMAMADRIAVMLHGDMVQVASPGEIYDRPSAYFVADFIGSPSMNLFKAKRYGPGRLECQLQQLADSVGAEELARVPGEDVYVGIRPEHLQTFSSPEPGAIEAVVDYIEPVGQTTNLFVLAQGIRFAASKATAPEKVGDRIWLKPVAEKTRLVHPD